MVLFSQRAFEGHVLGLGDTCSSNVVARRNVVLPFRGSTSFSQQWLNSVDSPMETGSIGTGWQRKDHHCADVGSG